MNRVFAVSLVLNLIAGYGYAQTGGELENVEIEIVKERTVTLPEAERKYSKIAPFASEPISPPITYSFRSLEIQLPLASLPVRPLKIKKEADEKPSKGQVSAALGNNASPYAEAYLTSSAKGKQMVGVHALLDAWVKGPVNGSRSGNGLYSVSAFGSTAGDRYGASGYVKYDNSYWHFYGHPGTPPPDPADALMQRLNTFAMGASVSGTPSSSFTYTTDASFGFMADRFDAKESKVDFGFKGTYKRESRRLRTAARYQILSRQDALVDAKPRNLATAEATYTLEPVEKLRIDVGLGFAFENDTLNGDFHVYPLANAQYPLSKQVTARAYVSGQMTSNSLHSLVNENPWLAPNVFIHHTNESFVLGGELETRLGRNLQAAVGGSVAAVENLYFYKNVEPEFWKFDTQFDEGTTRRSNAYITLDYAKSQTTTLSLRGDWTGYGLDTLSAAWHKPTYKLALFASHNFYKKVKIAPSLVVVGGMKAYDGTISSVVTLDPAIDLSLRADYFVSEKILLFLQGANLLATEYPLYFHYPARGLQMRVGLSWAF